MSMSSRIRKGRDEEAVRTASQGVLFPELEDRPATAPDPRPASESEPEPKSKPKSKSKSKSKEARTPPRRAPLEPDDVLPKPKVRAAVRAGDHIQHVGSWLMLAGAEQHGLYYNILGHWGRRRGVQRIRHALDGVLMSLAIGQGCIEGVRRLETASAPLLYRAQQAPSASWVRRTWQHYCDKVPAWRVHAGMVGAYLRQAEAGGEEAAVFYVDNHMRPYRGKHVLRKGWRMQDKRAVAGSTDYWIHDAWGLPIMKVQAPDHGSLTSWLKGIVEVLQLGLGEEERLLVAFDRAGAYPEHLAELRDHNVEFVTYERRPYAQLTASAFTETVAWRGQALGVQEGRANLKSGRGRVRRIALHMPDGNQVNLLSSSQEPKERLIEVMLGRWCQENAFKHGVERWGLNQLDRRQVEHYDPETVIPNPARRRLDRELRLVRVEEGLARRELARLAEGDHRRRERQQQRLERSLKRQAQLEALWPSTPTHAPLEETELAGELVHHVQDVKLVLDTIRIVCQNVEAHYAYCLAQHLPRAAEAKMNLKNLFQAPGKVTVGKKAVHVYLQPAGSSVEQQAYEAFYAEINNWRLTMPADHPARLLQFHPHPS